MKFKYITIAIIVTALSFISCGDFLEPNSKSEFVPKDAVSLNELLLGEAYQLNTLSGLNIFLNLMEDDIEAAPYQKPIEGFNANKYLASFCWQPEMFKIMEEAGSGHINLYESYYKLIKGANAVLDYIPDVTDTELNINKVKAQAYALRGFYYFNLVNIFGQPYNYNKEAMGVPLKLHSGIETNLDNLARRSVEDVYAQILADLHTAEEIYLQLPESEQWSNNYRTSLPMVQLMLSRTYLYMERWEEAAKYAKMVMDDKRFALFDLNTVIPESKNEEGNIVRNYPVMPTYNCSETIWPYGYVVDMFQWTYDYVNKENPDNGDKMMHAYFQASKGLLNTFVDYDKRLGLYIVEASDGNNGTMKMAYGKVNIGQVYYLPLQETNTFGRCLRLSEAYLNYAEAQAMIGGDSIVKATSALNALGWNRFDQEDFEEYSFSSQEEIISFIRDERRRELCFEGHRWFDLRRWGMPEITHTWYDEETKSSIYKLEKNDLMYTVPIPKEAIDMNSKLEQNDLPEKRVPVIVEK